MWEDDKPLYYSKGETIWKRPVSRRVENGTLITMGFPVCTMHDAAKGQAAIVAQLMNAGAVVLSGL
jgi:hypothetical protein